MRPDLLDKNPHTQDMIYESGLRGTLFGIETLIDLTEKNQTFVY
jgi:hypothetical protein